MKTKPGPRSAAKSAVKPQPSVVKAASAQIALIPPGLVPEVDDMRPRA